MAEAPKNSGRAVQQTPDRGFIIAEWSLSFTYPYSGFYVIKTDENGDTGAPPIPPPSDTIVRKTY